MNYNVAINNNCELIVSPGCQCFTGDTDSPNTYHIEFLVNPNINSNSTIKISDFPDCYIYNLEEDGLYIYYNIEVLTEPQENPDNSDLYYVPDFRTLYFNGEEVKNITDLLPHLSVGLGDISYEEIPVFSICKLKKYILNLEQNHIANCSQTKCSKSNDTNNFLFISLYVLENLICQQRYSEANKILESLKTCNLIDSKKCKTCNCNG